MSETKPLSTFRPESKSLSGQGGTFIYLEHETDIKPNDFVVNNATINAVLDYVKKEKDAITSDAALLVCREDGTMSITNRRHGLSRVCGIYDITYPVHINAVVKEHQDLDEIRELMGRTYDSPQDLFKALRVTPYLFESRQDHTEILNKLKNVQVTITRKASEVGENQLDLKKMYESHVEGAPDMKFKIAVQLFQGHAEKTIIDIDVMWDVNRSGTGICATLENFDFERIVKDELSKYLSDTIDYVLIYIPTVPVIEVNSANS